MPMIITAHQPNTLIGLSVLSKVVASDAVIWLDEVQYTKGGWSNRNRTLTGQWLTVPVERHCSFKPLNRVRIGEPDFDWRGKMAHRLRSTWDGDVVDRVCAEIHRPYRLLVGLNVALLKILLESAGSEAIWAFQSHLDGGHAVVSQSEDSVELAPISERLAMMVEELGGTTYLSGPSGRNYLDETPFTKRGLEVAYWKHEGPNPCGLDLVASPVHG
jgi:hypothetical protein